MMLMGFVTVPLLLKSLSSWCDRTVPCDGFVLLTTLLDEELKTKKLRPFHIYSAIQETVDALSSLLLCKGGWME